MPVTVARCSGCGRCIPICEPQAIRIQWNEQAPLVMKKMAEYALGAVSGKAGKLLFVNFVTQVSPACDCYGYSDTPIVNDIGILASGDPVAIDHASVDLVNQELGNRASKLPRHWENGEDKFRALYPEVDWNIQLAYAEEIGLGTRNYELIKI